MNALFNRTNAKRLAGVVLLLAAGFRLARDPALILTDSTMDQIQTAAELVAGVSLAASRHPKPEADPESEDPEPEEDAPTEDPEE